MEKIKVFYSYSHKDESFRSALKTHLSILRRRNVISEWHDRKIIPGTEWQSQIDENIKDADIILLLISPDFIASDYCYETELDIAMERHESKEASVIPIILRPTDWSDTPFSRLQALPEEVTPISKWENEDDAWLSVIKGLKSSIKEICLRKNRFGETHEFHSLNDLLRKELEEIDQAFNLDDQPAVRGIPTGLHDLDSCIDGISKAELTVIAARPEMGQSLLALQIASHVAIRERKAVAVFSLNFSSDQLMRRLIGSESLIKQETLVRGRLEEDDWPRLTSGVSALKDAPLHIDDSMSLTSEVLLEKCRKVLDSQDVELIIIDGLERLLFNDRNNGLNKQKGDISKELSEFARSNNMPIILTCNLEREVDQRTDKRPFLSDLHPFGSLADDAGTVIFLYRDEIYNDLSPDLGIAELIIAKNTSLDFFAKVKVAYSAQYYKFNDLVAVDYDTPF